MTDISIKTYESYLTFTDTDAIPSSRALSITKNFWYTQIFKAKTSSIPRFFFLADISTIDNNGDTISNSDNLTVELWSVTGTTNQTFALDSVLYQYTGPFDELTNPSDTSLYANEDLKWYQVNLTESPVSVTENNYYAFVFKSEIETNTGGAPIIYYSESPRYDVFPIMFASNDRGSTWSNNIVETRSSGTIKIGGLCVSYVGKEVNNTTSFNSGDVTIGGLVSSRRGYPVYMFVENDSTDITKKLSLDFNMIPPTSVSNGSSDETDQSMMRWYFYSPASLPLTQDSALKKANSVFAGSKPTLDSNANFVLYTQPDRLPPVPKAFFEENDMDLQNGKLDVNPLYVYEPNYIMNIDDEIIKNVENKFSSSYWAHFAQKYNLERSGNAIDTANSSNPSYIDFSLENQGSEIITLSKLTLSSSIGSTLQENDKLRGVNNVVKFGEYYIAFGKYQTDTDGANVWYDYAPNDSSTGNDRFIAYVAHQDSLSSWSRMFLNLSDGQSSFASTTKFIGVHDVCVVKTGSSLSEETLCIIFQTYPDFSSSTAQYNSSTLQAPDGSNSEFFIFGYTKTALSGTPTSMTINLLPSDNVDEYDAIFLPVVDQDGNARTTVYSDNEFDFPLVDADYQGAKFIIPQTGNKIFYTVRNCRNAYAGTGDSKFGIWELTLTNDFDSISSISDISSSSYNSSVSELDNRGFDNEISVENEISYIYKYNDIVYMGTNNYISFLTSEKMGQVYQTKDFDNFIQTFNGSIDLTGGNNWIRQSSNGLSYADSLYFFDSGNARSYAYDHVINDKVSFMVRVQDILHVWISPSVSNMSNTPFHIGIDLSNSETKLLRKFPIVDSTSNAPERSKSLRNIDGGVVNGHSIILYGKEGEGKVFKTYGISSVSQSGEVRTATLSGGTPFSDGVSIGYKSYDNQGLPPMYAYIKGVTPSTHDGGPFRIVGSSDSPSIVYEVGGQSDPGAGSSGTVVVMRDQYRPGTSSIRWVIYDDRIINKAFDNLGTAPFNTEALEGYSSTGVVATPNSPFGYYDDQTEVDFDYFENSDIHQRYPAFDVENRSLYYIGVVARNNSSINYSTTDFFDDASNFDPTNTEEKRLASYLGLYHYDSSANEVYNVNPKMVSQKGVSYLICNNGFYDNIANSGTKFGKGMQIYKTYGFKQLPENWGSTTGIDREIYERSSSGANAYKNETDTFSVSETNGVNFITTLKADNYDSSISRGNFVNPNEPDRHIYYINNGYYLPQHLSFFYNIVPYGAYVDPETIGVDDGDDGIYSYSDPEKSSTSLTLRWAPTLDELFESEDYINIPLGQNVTANQRVSDINLFSYTFPTDREEGFYRLESGELLTRNIGIGTTTVSTYDPSTHAPFAEILVKGLRFYNVDMGGAVGTTGIKKLAITGIATQNTDPSDIVSTEGGGVFIPPGGDIIVSFPKEVYINELSFNVSYNGSVTGSAALTTFNIETLPVFGNTEFGSGIISDSDWTALTTPAVFDPSTTQVVTVENIRRFTKFIRIKSVSGVTVRINNLKAKSLVEENTPQFEVSPSSSAVANPHLILVDDLESLLIGSIGGSSTSSFALFNQGNASLIFDLGNPNDGRDGFPVNRISINMANAESTRTIAIDVWDGAGSVSWDNVYTGPVINYEYSVVQWKPRLKSESRIVEIKILNATDYVSQNLASKDGSQNFSTYLDGGSLSGASFRPTLTDESSVTIVDSESDVDGFLLEVLDDGDGTLTFNAQMDEDGPFSEYVSTGLGLIERNLNLNFPIRQVKQVRIRTLNDGKKSIRMNGLRIYTPVIDSDGDPIWPLSTVSWNIKLSATVSG